MNREEAQRALKERLIVTLRRLGRSDQPYIGKLVRELSDGTFWFRGNSGSEMIQGKVKSDEISFSRKEE